MKIIFIGGFFPKEHFNQIKNESKGQLANANNVLQWSYIEGLKKHSELSNFDLNVISIPQIGAFPFKYKKLRFKVKSKSFGINEGVKGICCSFINIIGLKHIFRYYSLKSHLNQILRGFPKNENILIVVYDIQIEYLKVAKYFQKKNCFIRTSLIVPDLIGYTGDPQNMIISFYQNFQQKQFKKLHNYIDSYVLISKHMIERLPINNKPFTVIEGIYNFDEEYRFWSKRKTKKILFYSGALDERNGVNNLIKAFLFIENPDIKLIICGNGPLKSVIEKAVKKDNRIIYKGQLDHSQVLRIQKDSFLLINPRPSGEEFTRYSFPSKTMEYFGSGVPVLMYKLEGVPKEYYNYCFTPQNESVEGLAKCIIEICNYEQESLEIIGKKAERFVKQEKNSFLQVGKLLDMTLRLFESENENSTN